MKYIIVCLGIMACCLFSCQPAGDGGNDDGANANKIVKGTITVKDASYWEHIKIGIFSGGPDGEKPYLDVMSNDTDINHCRVVYSSMFPPNPPVTIENTPVSGTSYSITGTGNTRSYTFKLPDELPASGVNYYFAAWYDANANGNLDLIDIDKLSPPANAGEYNRCALKATLDHDDNEVTVYVPLFMKYMGIYVYEGYESVDDWGYHEIVGLDEETNSGFNFNFDFPITGASGW